jgi:hypothetical protein
MNDNTSTKLFDIVGKKSADFLIGATKVEALLKFNMASNALSNWNDAQSIFSVCTAQAGSPLPATLVMTAGDAGTGAACTGVYNYEVGKADIHTATGANTAANQRMCRWCTTVKSSNDCVVHLKEYAPPTTADKVIKGIVIIATAEDGAATGVLGA